MSDANTFEPAVLDRLEKLRDKYAAMGQDLVSYLDGLLHADFPTYWDYINLDTLLSLQQPVTPLPRRADFYRLPPDNRTLLQVVAARAPTAA